MNFMRLLFWVRGGDMINFKKIVFVTISLLFYFASMRETERENS